MSVVLKPNEALSHGRIMRIKREERQTIQKQVDAFFAKGGKIERVQPGVSGEKSRNGFNNQSLSD